MKRKRDKLYAMIFLSFFETTDTHPIDRDLYRCGILINAINGTAVFWLNCTDGKEDYLTHHAGESPTEGIKYGLNVWFREGIFS